MTMNLFRLPCFLLVIFLASCGQPQSEESEETADSLLSFRNEQMETAGMRLGKVNHHMFYDSISCFGQVVAGPAGYSMISSPVNGTLEKAFFAKGDWVEKGKALFRIVGADLLDVQQEYASQVARLEKADADFSRLSELAKQQVGSQKELRQAGAEFQMARAQAEAGRLKLLRMGIDPEQVAKGIISSSILLPAPFSGFLISTPESPGANIGAEEVLASMVDPSSYSLSLEVFEKDLSHIRAGMEFKFFPGSDRSLSISARLTQVGGFVDPLTRVVPCRAEILPFSGTKLLWNARVEAIIHINPESAPALPVRSVVRKGPRSFVLRFMRQESDRVDFSWTPVITGRESGGFVEIKTDLSGRNIVVAGLETLSPGE